MPNPAFRSAYEARILRALEDGPLTRAELIREAGVPDGSIWPVLQGLIRLRAIRSQPAHVGKAKMVYTLERG